VLDAILSGKTSRATATFPSFFTFRMEMKTGSEERERERERGKIRRGVLARIRIRLLIISRPVELDAAERAPAFPRNSHIDAPDSRNRPGRILSAANQLNDVYN